MLETIDKIKREKKKRRMTKLYTFKLIAIFFVFIIIQIKDNNNGNSNDSMKLNYQQKIEDFQYKNFSILRRLSCPTCGIFSFFIVHLGCIKQYLSMGYIPIIDLQSFPNVYNKGNLSSANPWEFFFHQPFNYSLEEVLKYAKNIKYFECTLKTERPNENYIYNNKESLNFWHSFTKKYSPIKEELLGEAKAIMKELFGGTKNILGIIMRGTDYISRKPKGHSIPPKIEQVIVDVKMMDKKYKYDFIFFTTEDEIIKKKFIPHFKDKLKLLNPKVKIQYNYTGKSIINLNKDIYGNIEFFKNYVLNIIILSKCLDIVAARCSGTAGIFVLSEGFRNVIVYNNGTYYRI